MDHSTMRPSEEMEMRDSPPSPLLPFVIHCTSHTASLCLPLPDRSLFSDTGRLSCFLMSYTATTPSMVPTAIKFGLASENLQDMILEGEVMIRSG